MEDKTNIKKELKKIIVFFDLFAYPLSAFELWQYSAKKFTLAEVIKVLDESTGDIAQKNGFYFLPGRAEIVETRARRYNYSNRKYKSAERFIRVFKYLPFIKAIALANSIGAHNLRDGSDIDFFVISAPHRIWLTRFILASAAKFLHRRPTAINKRDKICLSFYVTTESLNLDSLQLPENDPYFFYWLRTLVLLYNKDKTYEKFLALNQIDETESEFFAETENAAGKSRLLDYLETIVKKIQLKIMSPALKAAMNNSTGVLVSDKVLKLYLIDNRAAYAEKYGNKIREIFGEGN
ncbi:MAG: hypothetical protein WC467_00130 [Patescibacteria group bacterium]